MKLAILGIRGIPAKYGGFETFAEELAVRLVQQGIEVTVFCIKQPSNQSTSYKGVQLQYVRELNVGPLTTILFDLLCLWRARSSYDVVYMLGYGASLFCFIPRLWGKEVWINMDGIEWARSKWSWPAKLWLKLMESIAMWTPDKIIADAEGILNHLQEKYRHIPPAVFIPYGAPVVVSVPPSSCVEEWGVKAQSYLLVVCRLEPENHVLEIIQGYLNSDILMPLIIVGNHLAGTFYTKSLLEYARSNIQFIGSIYDQDKLLALRCHSFAYLHGHSVGGTNPSLLEAMGCSNKIIAHDNRFNREVSGKSALYFKDAISLSMILNNLGESAPSGKAAQQIISDKYTWGMVVNSYLELLNKSK